MDFNSTLCMVLFTRIQVLPGVYSQELFLCNKNIMCTFLKSLNKYLNLILINFLQKFFFYHLHSQIHPLIFNFSCINFSKIFKNFSRNFEFKIRCQRFKKYRSGLIFHNFKTQNTFTVKTLNKK